jgi:hypothetical protein
MGFDYRYEGLGDDRFQQFCQALLLAEHHDVQAFPLGQSDGGRDAATINLSKLPFVVYQVKYTNQPSRVKDVNKWLQGVVRKELPSINRLAQQGMNSYVLLTNVVGTASPGAGSIDKVQAFLNEAISIPAACWWRNDISRRLENHPHLKWTYPEILSGADVLEALVLAGTDQAHLRTLRMYLKTQYDKDSQVRFREIQLQDSLSKLFVDVPLVLRPRQQRSRMGASRLTARFSDIVLHAKANDQILVTSTLDTGGFISVLEDDRRRIGAAQFLLDPSTQASFPCIVLEGAPGQGKSTIGQFVCQHYRRLLLETPARRLPPTVSVPPGVRLPFRIDLRDYALWLQELDPLDPTSTERPAGWHPSVESFVASQVRGQSGGLAFTPDHLIGILRSSSSILVLDGLDEVADIAARRQVVDQISQSVRRLSDSCEAIQFVITSRPAAYVNSPAFPEEEFLHCTLTALTSAQIDEYRDKWSAVKGLTNAERAQVKDILRLKLGDAHMRELTRNPMQLSIVLSLIHTRGPSLPDKRTELYDAYVELFISREAEKSAIVRDNRDLLIAIHRYLAWCLQTEAEGGRSTGRISQVKLIEMLRSYLVREKRDPDLAELLFQGIAERVVALVSRIQGTFEFEVQPIREYFCARYLYDTVPYYAATKKQAGTLPDRFEALAKNPYWLNVARFFAGCFTSGELAALVLSLEEILASDEFKYSAHPRSLGLLLLSDWVLAAHRHAATRLAELVVDDLLLATAGPPRNNPVSMSLPDSSGREELLHYALTRLEDGVTGDFLLSACRAARANAPTFQLTDWWCKEADRAEGGDKHRLALIADALGLLPALRPESVPRSMRNGGGALEQQMVLSGAFEYFLYPGGSQEVAIDLILDGLGPPSRPYSGNLLSQFSDMCWRLHILPLESLGIYRPSHREHLAGAADSEESDLMAWCRQTLDELTGGPMSGTAWSSAVERGRLIWGERWAWARVGLTSGLTGVAPAQEKRPPTEVLEGDDPLCDRLSAMVSKASATRWWAALVESASNHLDEMIVLSGALTWMSVRTITQLEEELSKFADGLSIEEMSQCLNLTNVISAARSKVSTRGSRLSIDFATKSSSARVLLLLARRTGQERLVYEHALRQYIGNDPAVVSFCADTSVEIAATSTNRWSEAVSWSRRASQLGISHGSYMHNLPTPALQVGGLLKVLAKPSEYSSSVVAVAEDAFRAANSRAVLRVGQVATKDRWFAAEDLSGRKGRRSRRG